MRGGGGGWRWMAYNLSNIYRPLFTNRNQASGEQFKFSDITRSMSKSDDGSR